MTEENKKVRTRFAPSPTGFIHIGNLRTVLYEYLLAKKYDGDFVLRIEDTDQKREMEGATEKILEALDWVGIRPDEGVCLENGEIVEKGELGPYTQSKRLDVYKKYIDELLEKGHAYKCFCSAERLDEVRKTQQKNGEAPRYDGHCRNLSKDEVEKKIAEGEKFVIRMRVPEGERVEVNDLVFGKIIVESDNIDDQVLIKSDGFPTYHFAVVVDDYLMKITHVVRAEEWLPSTPKHVLLYDFFGWEKPVFVHVPNVIGENKKKLSKRRDAVSVEDFKKEGYLPEALVNFLALLGWNPGKGSTEEIFSLADLERVFNEENIHKAGAIFDKKKLGWMNSHYIKEKSDEDFFELTEDYFKKYAEEKKLDFEKEKEKFAKIAATEKERVKKLSEITENIDFYFEDPKIDLELIRWKDLENIILKEKLEKMKEAILAADFSDAGSIQGFLMSAAGEERGEHLHPLRTSLSGEKNSPAPWEIAWVIGKESAVERIQKVQELLK